MMTEGRLRVIKLKADGLNNRQELGIKRVDDGRQHWWFVRMQRRGVLYCEIFSDKQYGGRAKAGRAAKEYCENILSTTSLYLLREYVQLMRKNNSSGLVGVARYPTPETRHLPEAKREYYWTASCPRSDGYRYRPKFYENKYGHKKAKQLAIAARTKAIHDLGDKEFDPAKKKRA